MRFKPSRQHIELFIAAETPQANERQIPINELESEFKVESYQELLRRHGVNSFPRWSKVPMEFFCRTCGTPLGKSLFMGIHVSKCPQCVHAKYDHNEAYLLSRYICKYPDELFTHLFGTYLGLIHYGKLDYAKLRAKIRNSNIVLNQLIQESQ